MAEGTPKNFNKGMVGDPSPHQQPEGTYRDATNVRLINNEGTSFTLQNINGNSLAFTLPCPPKVQIFSFDPSSDMVEGNTYSVDITIGANTETFSGTFSNSTALHEDLSTLLSIDQGGGGTNELIPTTQSLYFSAFSPSGASVWVADSTEAVAISLANSTVGGSAKTFLSVTTQSEASCKTNFVGDYSFNNDLYLFTVDTINLASGVKQYGHIWRVTFNQDDTIASQTLVYAGKLFFDTANKLIVRGLIENNCITRLVWTDNLNPLRTINVADENLMAVSVDGLSATPKIQMQAMILTDIAAGGTLPVGGYQFCYRYISSSGSSTNISPLTNIIFLPSSASDLSGNAQEIEGDVPGQSSGKAITISINNLNQEFSDIEILVIQYATLNGGATVFSIPTIPITGTELTYQYSAVSEHEGQIEEVTVRKNTWKYCKAIEVKDNILFAANLRNVFSSVSFDTEVKRYDNPSVVGNQVGRITNESSFLNNTHRYIKGQISDGSIQRYVLGGESDGFATGSGIRFTFNVNRRLLDDTPENFNIRDEYSYNTLDALSYPNDEGYNYTQPVPESNASPYYSSVYRGYQRCEIYRFGIVFYDLDGAAGFAQWIGDIQMPEHHDTKWSFTDTNNNVVSVDPVCPDYRLAYIPGIENPATVDAVEEYGVTYPTDNDYHHYAHDLGVKFEVALPSAIKDLISGYSIVRVKRENKDRTILGQGILNPTRTNIDSDSSAGFFGSFLTGESNTNGWGHAYEFNNSIDGYVTPHVGGAAYTSTENYVNAYIDEWPGRGGGPGDDNSNEIRYYNFSNSNKYSEGAPQYDDVTGESSAKGANTWNFGWPLNDSVKQDLFTFDSPDIMSDTLGFSYSGGDSIQVISSLKMIFEKRITESIGTYASSLGTFAANPPVNKYPFRKKQITPSADNCNACNTKAYILSKFMICEPGLHNGKSYKRAAAWSGGASFSGWTGNLGIDNFDSVASGGTRSIGGYSFSNVTLDQVIQRHYWSFTSGVFLTDEMFPYCFSTTENTKDDNCANWSMWGASKAVYGTNTSLIKTLSNLEVKNVDAMFYNEVSSIRTNFSGITQIGNGYQNDAIKEMPYKFLANITRALTKQYGGNSSSELKQSRYIQTGQYTPVFNDSTELYHNDVYGGDTYINLYTYSLAKPWVNWENQENNSDCYYGAVKGLGQSFPCEAYVNTSLRMDINGNPGYLESPYLETSLDSPCLDKSIFELDVNGVYSQEPDTVGFLPLQTDDNCVVTTFPNEIAYSNTKIAGDKYDAWAIFQPANFHDVDANYGEVNSLFMLKNEIYFIQDNAMGHLVVNPRTMITDSSGGQIYTGTGDTIQNHKYISNEFGTLHQHSVSTSDSFAYWADVLHDKIFKFDGSGISSLGEATGSKKLLRDILSGYTYLNSSTTDYSQIKKYDTPLEYKGIHSIYDYRNNELIFTFFDEYDDSPVRTYYNTIAYNESTKYFTSRYTYTPSYWIRHRNNVYSARDYGKNFLGDNPQARELWLWDSVFGTRCNFDGVQGSFNVTFVYNDFPHKSKVFDNAHIIYEAEDDGTGTIGNPSPYVFQTITLSSNTNNTDSLTSATDGRFSYRDGSLKFPTRAIDATNRLRGNYMTMKLLELTNSSKLFNIFAIGSRYRISKR